MSDNSLFFGEDEDVIKYDLNAPIDDDDAYDESTIESSTSAAGSGDEEEQFEEADDSEVRKASNDFTEQKSQSPSEAELRRKSIQSLQDEIRSLRKSLQSADISQKTIHKASLTTKHSQKSSSKSVQTSEKETIKGQQKSAVGKRTSVDGPGTKLNELFSVDHMSMSLAPSSMLGPQKKQNTYQLDPRRPFANSKALVILDSVLAINLVDFPIYEANAAKLLSKVIAGDVRARLKGTYDRCKLIVEVFIGEKHQQGINIDARCLWDKERDHLIFQQFQGPDYFVLVICCGVYRD